MAKDTPDRLTISLPEDAPVDTSDIDALVEESECENRSEYIRKLIAEDNDND